MNTYAVHSYLVHHIGCGLVTRLYQTLVTPWTVVTRLLCPGKNTGIGCIFLLQGVFLTKYMSPALTGRFVTTDPPRKLTILNP